MAKLSRRDVIAYLLLIGGVAATTNPNIVQGVLDKIAPVEPAITYGPSVLGDSDATHATQSVTADATVQATEQSTESVAATAASAATPPRDPHMQLPLSTPYTGN